MGYSAGCEHGCGLLGVAIQGCADTVRSLLLCQILLLLCKGSAEGFELASLCQSGHAVAVRRKDSVGVVHSVVDGDRCVAVCAAAEFIGRAVCHTVESRIGEAVGLGPQGRHRHNRIACQGSRSWCISGVGLGRIVRR